MLINSYRFATAGPTDPSFANVSLLLHGNGTNGQQTPITDNSPSPKTVTAFGNAQISTAIADPFGNSTRGVIALDGTGDYLAAPDSSSFSFGFNDFTIEFWLYLIATATNNTLYGSCLYDGRTIANLNGHSIFIRSSGSLRLWESNLIPFDSAAGAVPYNAWCHIASSKNAGTTRAFVNGSEVINHSNNRDHASQGLTVGGVCDFRDTSANFKLNGYIDDLRITKGISRYNSAFTPPTAPFPDS